MMKTKSSFTLIELLIVIGIIGILVTMLLPVAGRAKASALQTQCSSNLLQSIKAMMMYSDASGGWLITTGEDYRGWFEQPGMPEYLGFAVPEDRYKQPKSYRPVTLCPAGVDEIYWVGNVSYGTAIIKPFINDYIEYKFEVISPNGEQFVRFYGIPATSNYVLLADTAYTQYNDDEEVEPGAQCRLFCRRDEGTASPASSAISQRHNGVANIAFADGHVETSQDKTGLLTRSKIGVYVDGAGYNLAIVEE